MSIVDGLGSLGRSDWDDYHATIVEPNQRPDRPYGGYAVGTRKRRQAIEAAAGCPFSRPAMAAMEAVPA
jgi:hypothetical protein